MKTIAHCVLVIVGGLASSRCSTSDFAGAQEFSKGKNTVSAGGDADGPGGNYPGDSDGGGSDKADAGSLDDEGLSDGDSEQSTDGGIDSSGDAGGGSSEGGIDGEGDVNGGSVDAGESDGASDLYGGSGETAWTEDEIRLACEEGQPKSLVEMLDYAALTGACPFGTDDNRAKKDGFMTARREQSLTVDLPDGAVLCGMSLKSVTTSIEVDDAVFFNADGFHLFNSWQGFTDHFDKEDDGLIRWDWKDIRDQSYVISQNTPFCWGNAGACVMPPQQSRGGFDVEFSDDAIIKLGKKVAEDHQIDFQLVTTGDDNSVDCSHSGIKLNATLRYVIMK